MGCALDGCNQRPQRISGNGSNCDIDAGCDGRSDPKADQAWARSNPAFLGGCCGCHQRDHSCLKVVKAEIVLT
jgi:hypothetical protein